MHIQENVNLQQYNTFHVAAVARYFLVAGKSIDLQEAIAYCSAKQLPFLLIGQGSNILFRHDYPGLVIELGIQGCSLLDEARDSILLKVNCGENWHDFVMLSLKKGWYGLENLALIPGTVGAAPVQNIGAYGVEFSRFCEGVEAIDTTTGELIRFDHDECEFDYRNSVFKREAGRYIITAVYLRLSKIPSVDISYGALKQALADVPGDSLSPQVVADAVIAIRRSKLPDPAELGNAGSFFRNPVIASTQYEALQLAYPSIPGYPEGDSIKVPAAWLIEQAGWKGFREGDVGVHSEHALVLVNHGSASGEALCALAERIQTSVLETFGISLDPEVRIIG